MDKSIKSFFIYYFPAILWAGLIFYFSSIPELKVGFASTFWELLGRKIAHIGEYAILGFLMLRIFRGHLNIIISQSVIFSLIIVIFYAISDEAHQMFTPGRAGKEIDIAVDTLGGILGITAGVIVYERKKYAQSFLAMLGASFLLVGILYNMEMERRDIEQEINTEEQSISSSVPDKKFENNISENKDKVDDKKILPGKIKLDVPFTSQAPYAKWDEYHEDACEEASLIMLKYFLDKKKLTPEIAEREILALIEHQNKKYGDYKDSDMAEFLEIARDYYGLTDLKIIYDFDKDELKKQLAKGSPIIIPAAGRRLGNTNFTGEGPLYHNLVAVGYDGNTIITNDPGTRKGEGYKYSLDTLYGAIHDFTGKKEDIENGRKAMIVVGN